MLEEDATALCGPRHRRSVTGRVWRGTAFGCARGRIDVPRIVDRYMDGKINIGDPITHTMPPDRINDALVPMHEGKSIRSIMTF